MKQDLKIITFCCNWCSYAAADLAGISRLQYPCAIRIIRVMCSGMVHPEMVLHALNQGADGVMVTGCKLGECHYQEGNHAMLSRSEVLEEILADFGYEKERFQLVWLSAAEPERLVEAIYEMHNRLLALETDPGD